MLTLRWQEDMLVPAARGWCSETPFAIERLSLIARSPSAFPL
jgi:hypothetical protein